MSFWSDLEQYGDALCVDGELPLSYQEVAELSDRIFPKKNKAVAVLVCGRDIATFLCYLGCLRSGIVPILLSEDMDDEGVATYISNYQAQYLCCKKDRYKKNPLKYAQEGVELFGHLVIELVENTHKIEDQLALLLTTSGTTSDPKLVRLSYDNIQENAESISACLGIDKYAKPITLLPFNYSFGLSVINSHLNKGATIVFSNEGLTSRGFWDAFRQYGITSFYGVPYHYDILKKFRFERLDFPKLKLMAQAGGRMAESEKQAFYTLGKLKGFKFVGMYGQTEATARIAYLPAEQFESKSASVGRAIPNGTLSILDPDSHGVGEVCYQGPNVSLGYACNIEDLALGDSNSSKLVTGDLGYLDLDGFLYLTGRKRRYIKVFGNNVNLDHVEKVASELVNDVAAVIGVDNQVKILVLKVPLETFKADILKRMTIHPKALMIESVPSLLYKSTGKVDYAALTERYLCNV